MCSVCSIRHRLAPTRPAKRVRKGQRFGQPDLINSVNLIFEPFIGDLAFDHRHLGPLATGTHYIGRKRKLRGGKGRIESRNTRYTTPRRP